MGVEPDAGAQRPRVRAVRLDAQRNRERLLEVARESFAGEGLSVPVDEIARRAGLGAGTIHRHFPTKESLFEAIVLSHVEELVAQGRRLLEADDPWQGFAEFCREMVERGWANRALGDILARIGTGAKEKIAVAVAQFDEVMDLLVLRAQQAGLMRRDVSPAEVRALLNGVHLSAEQTQDPATVLRLVAVLCDGLRANPS